MTTLFLYALLAQDPAQSGGAHVVARSGERQRGESEGQREDAVGKSHEARIIREFCAERHFSEAELIPNRIDVALGFLVHDDRIGPAAREALVAALDGRVDAHLRAVAQ